MESAMRSFNIRRFWTRLGQFATIGSFILALMQVAPTASPPRLTRRAHCDASVYAERIQALRQNPDQSGQRYIWLGDTPDHSIFYDQEKKEVICYPQANPGRPIVRTTGRPAHDDPQTRMVLLVGVVTIAMCGMGIKICHWVRDARDGK
jgi:hypothetical protein